MADADVQITAGSGTKVDTRTVGAGSDEHRQVVVIGDPTTAARVAIVDANGGLLTTPLMQNGNPLQVANADDLSGSDTLAVGPLVFNGTNWDRLRGNTQGLFAQGNVAHDAVDSGNPIKIGGRASNTAPTAVASGDRVNAWFLPEGQQVVYLDGSTIGPSSGLTVEGTVVHDAVDSGNPIKIGGKAITSNLPTAVVTLDRVDAMFDVYGRQAVTGTPAFTLNDGASNGSAVGIAGFGDTAYAPSRFVPTMLMGFNGSTWDRIRVANTGRLQVDVVSGGSVAQGGDVAHDAVDSGNPVKIGGKARSSAPGAVSASGDRVDAWFGMVGEQYTGIYSATDGLIARVENTSFDALPSNYASLASLAQGYVYNGSTWDRVRSIGGLPAADANTGIQAVAQVPHKVGYTIASATAQYTTTQTSTTLGPTVSASQRMVVTSIQIQAGGTTAGSVQVYFGTGAYSRGTTPAVFDGSFTPSATNHPGYAQSPSVPYMGAADAELRVTTSAAVNPLTVTVWYYLVAV